LSNNIDKPLSTTQRAIFALREMIFTGDLPAGSDHLESELALRLGMSRTPVREAALMLESQGLIELRPRKGVHILPVSPTDMQEIYDVLTELESLSARRAAEQKLSDKDLTTLRTAVEDMDIALAEQDLEAWSFADDEFHRELVFLGDNARVRTIFELMNDQVRRARAVTLFMRPLPEKSNQDHRIVLDAIRRGDAELAANAHRAHRQAAKVMMLELLERHRLTRI